MGRMNSEKLFWKAHVCIIQVEHKTKADKERDRKINSISLEMSLENREEANEYTVILAFGGGEESFISPFIVPPVLLQTISTLMSLLMACRKCIQ